MANPKFSHNTGIRRDRAAWLNDLQAAKAWFTDLISTDRRVQLLNSC